MIQVYWRQEKKSQALTYSCRAGQREPVVDAQADGGFWRVDDRPPTVAYRPIADTHDSIGRDTKEQIRQRRIQHMEKEVSADWVGLPNDVRSAMSVAWRNGMPPSASALYARWWQLETWMRSLVYVELRAAYGPDWASRLPKFPEKRRLGDQAFRYMVTPDAQALLAYTDATNLFEIIETDWPLFEDALLQKAVWAGRTVELRNIRNRIGHCRRPHADDLSRLEQTLRDLEGGAFRAAAAFNRQSRVPKAWKDPLVEAWVECQHETAQRLIEHARRKYDTTFHLLCSRRPWVASTQATPPLSGTGGYVWHATWHMRNRGVNLRDFWEDNAWDALRETILLVCATGPHTLEISFPMLEDPAAVATTIGTAFDLVLHHQLRGDVPQDAYERWSEINADLDPRVQTRSTWSIVDDSTKPISIFGA